MKSLVCCLFFLFGPCTWEPGQGVPGCRGGLRPFLLCSCSCLVFKRLPQEWSYLSFHLFTCTMGFAPIKWTCTAFFRPRQLTDRAILANRQPQEKKDMARRMGLQITVLSLDTAVSCHYGNLDVQSTSWSHLLTLYKQGWIAATLAGPPCETFSEARFTQLRGVCAVVVLPMAFRLEADS